MKLAFLTDDDIVLGQCLTQEVDWKLDTADLVLENGKDFDVAVMHDGTPTKIKVGERIAGTLVCDRVVAGGVIRFHAGRIKLYFEFA